jgi:hypothetical protein
MRYRSLTSPAAFWDDVATFTDFVGPGEYMKSLRALHDGLNKKGYVTQTDDLRFSLELQLFNIELLRRQLGGRFPATPEALHEAADFIIGLGQTIPILSPPARKKLRGQIISGLKTNGLRPLQHEMRVAEMLSKLGFDIVFGDLEGVTACDILAEKEGLSCEVEAKSLPIFSGYPILPQDADKFFLEIRRHFRPTIDRNSIPVLNITLRGRLSPERGALLEMVAACNQAVEQKASSATATATIAFGGTIPDDAPAAELAAAARQDAMQNGIAVYVTKHQPKVMIRMRSDRPSKLPRNILSTISEAAKRQFTGARPGIIWLHVDYISQQFFDEMTYAKSGPSFFDSIANAVFSSPKRNHIIQLVFSGGARFVKRERIVKSSYWHVAYNSPNATVGGIPPLQDGRNVVKPHIADL